MDGFSPSALFVGDEKPSVADVIKLFMAVSYDFS
jgi:hypothetical protein